MMHSNDIQAFIDGMKEREAEERRLADEHLLRATAIQGERMKLESVRHSCELRDEKLPKPADSSR